MHYHYIYQIKATHMRIPRNFKTQKNSIFMIDFNELWLSPILESGVIFQKERWVMDDGWVLIWTNECLSSSLFQYSGFLVIVFVVELSAGAAGFVYKKKVSVSSIKICIFICMLCREMIKTPVQISLCSRHISAKLESINSSW